jgi:hypothetical protein
MRLITKLAVLAALACFALCAAAIPAGRQVRVRLAQSISSASARTGEAWEGTLASDVVVNGKTVAAKGAPVRGKIAEAKSSGRLSSPGILKLRVTSIGGLPVQTGVIARQGASHKGRNTKAIGGTAAAGAIIGAIAGGGKGAAIGAGAGAAAGTAGAAATGKKDVHLPVETVLTFTIR